MVDVRMATPTLTVVALIIVSIRFGYYKSNGAKSLNFLHHYFFRPVRLVFVLFEIGRRDI